MNRSTRSVRLTILTALALVACEEGTGGRDGGAPNEAAQAEYSREMFFVATDATAGALLDFTTVELARGVRRTARAWAEDGSGWTPLFDLDWRGEPVRHAWRLVPHGPLRLRVGLDDDVEAIMVRDAEQALATLETGDFVAEWAPFRSTHVLLRQATLSLRGNAVEGWLVDARFGMPPVGSIDADDDFGVESLSAAEPAAELATGQDSAVVDTDSADDASADTVSVDQEFEGSPTLAVRSVRGVLVAEDGATLVIADADGGLVGWFWSPDLERTIASLTLTPLPGDREAWRIESNEGVTLAGRLESLDEMPMPVAPRLVRGTFDVGDAELEMHGVMRPPADE